MAAQVIATTNLWLDGEDWSWPVTGSELGPPAWIPALPDGGGAPAPLPQITAARLRAPDPLRELDAPGPAAWSQANPAPVAVARRFTIVPPEPAVAARPRRRSSRWRVARQRLIACVALLLVFGATFELAARLGSAAGPTHAHGGARAAGVAGAHGAAVAPGLAASPPVPGPLASSHATLSIVSRDAGGSSVARVHYSSLALHRRASFLVYLPPGYTAGTAHRYPVLYLLHGDNQLANAYLQVGLPTTLDHLIGSGAVHPLIAVMLEGARRTDNWRNDGATRYEDYVVETQQLVDRMLPTVANRGGRAIAGLSMGGFGAMNVALGHLDRYSVVESWLGFFNHLGPELAADASLFQHLPLTAFVYGAASDSIADPTENAPFAAALRAAGASATSAVYPGGHNLATIQAHLSDMLVFAGRALSPGS